VTVGSLGQVPSARKGGAPLEVFEPGEFGSDFCGENGEPFRRNRFSDACGTPPWHRPV